MHGHTLEHPILALPRTAAPFLRSSVRVRPHSCRSLLRERRPSPLEEGSREPRAATALPVPAYDDASTPQDDDAGNHRPIATPLAGGASTRPPLAAVVVGRQRWTARAEPPRAKDLPLVAACCRRTTGVKIPLLFERLEHPSLLPSSIVRPEGWMLPSSSANRPRPSFQRRPAKGNALPKAGVPSTTWNPTT